VDTTKQKLVDSIEYRISSEVATQNPVKFLKDPSICVSSIVDIAVSVLYLFTREGRGNAKEQTALVAEVAGMIGHSIRNSNKLKRDSALAAKSGAFILYSFELLGIIRVVLGKASNGHATYLVEVLDDDALVELWEGLNTAKTEKLPSTVPYAPWESTRHASGAIMVKTENKAVLAALTPDTHPIVFNCLNKAQEVGWNINEPIYNVYTWALRNKTDAFADIWEMHNPEAKASKIREAKAIGNIAKRFIGKNFYHLYYFDFRGRKYAATAYLHEQGTDLAKGLLLRADAKAIGEQGFFWLMVSIASNWAGDAGREDGAKTDKIPLVDRVHWSADNEEILLSYAESPKVNQGWMKAEKPWQFLAACMELLKLRLWQASECRNSSNDLEDMFGYESHLECYIDGSNNGSQHLSALTRDEITAPHVNLVPLDLPGDLYKYVADHVWSKIEADVAKLTKKELKDCENFIDTLTDFKNQIAAAPMKSDRRKELIADIIQFKKSHDGLLAKAAPVFWNRITDGKHRRKICKRNIMTLPYGGTAYGLGVQQIEDARKHGIAQLLSMEHAWGSYLGRAIFEDCRVSLKRPMQLLSVFESAGKVAEKDGRFLSWNVPVTNFPVVQNYVEGSVKKIWVQYGPPVGLRNSTGYFSNTLQLAVCFMEDTKPSKGKQSQGASPNAIHSLDAAHLALAVTRSDFPVTTIHDSFGCLLGDMAKLFVIIRETFVELYAADPLTSLIADIGGNLEGVELGTLDTSLVLDSEYCFA
jgi:DNA-directed RNA polymerase